MTSQRDLKTLIRERMGKTGESYMTARERLLACGATSHDAVVTTTTQLRPWHPLLKTTREDARALLDAALRSEPRLCSNGLGVFDEHKKRARIERAEIPVAQLEAEFATARIELADALDQIAAAADWIAQQQESIRFNTKHDSYGYKHHVERWFDARGGPHLYVSNGSFIAAAIGLGWETRPGYPGSPNVQLRFAERGVKATARRNEGNDAIARQNEGNERLSVLQRSAELWTQHIGSMMDEERRWTSLDSIVEVVGDAIAADVDLHAMWPGEGESEVDDVGRSREPGCIEFAARGGNVHVLKPKELRLEVFPDAHSYFWLDFDVLPGSGVHAANHPGAKEAVTDLGSSYVSRSYWEEGSLSYEEHVPLPAEARPVVRHLRSGSLLFVAKGTPFLQCAVNISPFPPAAAFREAYRRFIANYEQRRRSR